MSIVNEIKQRVADAHNGDIWIGVNTDEAAELLGEVERLTAELTRLDKVEIHANAVQEENDRLHKLVDDLRQGDGHEAYRAELAEAERQLAPHEHCGRIEAHIAHNTDSTHWCCGDAVTTGAPQ